MKPHRRPSKLVLKLDGASMSWSKPKGGKKGEWDQFIVQTNEASKPPRAWADTPEEGSPTTAKTNKSTNRAASPTKILSRGLRSPRSNSSSAGSTSPSKSRSPTTKRNTGPPIPVRNKPPLPTSDVSASPPPSLHSMLALGARRQRASTISAVITNPVVPSEDPEKDKEFLIDKSTLRKTKSENFLHSWEYTPVFCTVKKSDVEKLITSKSKKKARREAKAKKSKEQKQSSKSTKSKASPSSAPAETSIRDSDTSPTRPSPPKKSPSSANKERKVPPNFRELKQGLEYSEDGKDLVAASLTTYLNCLISVFNQQQKLMFIRTYSSLFDAPTLLKELNKRLKFSLQTSNITSVQLQRDLADFLILWIKESQKDFCDNEQMFENLADFLNKLRTVNKMLTKDIENLLKEQAYMLEEEVDLEQIEEVPLPLMAQGPEAEAPSFLDIHSLELARQLTLADYEAFQGIEPSELIGCPWTKKDSESSSPNVTEMIKSFNAISFWVATEIVSAPNKKLRVAVLKRFLQIMGHLRGLNNFHTLMAIYCGLMMFEIQRLSATWKAIGSKDAKFMDEIAKLLDSKGNWSTLRQTITEIISKNKGVPPAKQIFTLPFHGMYLKAFIGIEENQTFIDEEQKVVNVSKLGLLNIQIEEIKSLQKPILKLWEVDTIQNAIKTWTAANMSEEKLLELSKLCESASEYMGSPPPQPRRKFERKQTQQLLQQQAQAQTQVQQHQTQEPSISDDFQEFSEKFGNKLLSRGTLRLKLATK